MYWIRKKIIFGLVIQFVVLSVLDYPPSNQHHTPRKESNPINGGTLNLESYQHGLILVHYPIIIKSIVMP